MKKIAITGKIGTGKSVLLNQFKFLGYKTYSSDQMVKDLYAKDKHIINEIRKLNSSLILNKKIRFDELSNKACLLYTSPSPRDPKTSRMPSSA